MVGKEVKVKLMIMFGESDKIKGDYFMSLPIF